jgi:hypothetical protein
MVTKQLDELAARQSRLEAERDGRARMEWPDEFADRRADPAVVKLWESSGPCSTPAAPPARARRASCRSASPSSGTRSSA